MSENLGSLRVCCIIQIVLPPDVVFTNPTPLVIPEPIPHPLENSVGNNINGKTFHTFNYLNIINGGNDAQRKDEFDILIVISISHSIYILIKISIFYHFSGRCVPVWRSFSRKVRVSVPRNIIPTTVFRSSSVW